MQQYTSGCVSVSLLAGEAVAAWQAATTGKHGRPRLNSDLAIETAPALRWVLHLPLCQTEEALRPIVGLVGAD